MVKLYNKTTIPDKLLEDLLLRAARACGKVRSAGVIVKVTWGKWNVRGLASRCSAVREFALKHLKGRTSKNKGRWPLGKWVATDGGWIRLTIPRLGDGLCTAETVYRYAVHEFGHVRDYQAVELGAWSSRGSNGRRPRWGDRPEEKRAQRYEAEARERVESGAVGSPEEAILNLALWIEDQGR